ncbi:MAG TPA: hypothetical protein VE871_10175 [Longimicrobium sp.]|nr:hypothetical protein [Longimicrobium sp.]
MRKLKLSIDALAVQSFDTAPLVRGLGTVHGHDQVGGGKTFPGCPSPVCLDAPLASCDGTCGGLGCEAYPTDAEEAAADTVA